MSLDRSGLYEELVSCSIGVRTVLSAAMSVGLPLQETSITDGLLLRLALRFGADLEVVPYTQNEEGKTGADWRWEWIFEGDSGCFSMIVQAKKLKQMTGGFGYDFGYQIGKSGRRQVDVLIDTAASLGMPALYALYNGPTLLNPDPCACAYYPSSLVPEVLGVGLVPAELARECLASTASTWVRQEEVVSDQLPLPCLALCGVPPVCAHGFGPSPTALGFPPGTPANDIAFSAAAAFDGLRSRTADRTSRRSGYDRGLGVTSGIPEGTRRRIGDAREGTTGDRGEGAPDGAVVFRGRRT